MLSEALWSNSSAGFLQKTLFKPRAEELNFCLQLRKLAIQLREMFPFYIQEAILDFKIIWGKQKQVGRRHSKLFSLVL